MAAITATTTFGQLYSDPTANPLGSTEAEIRASYHVIYSQYIVEDPPPTVEELEGEILADFVEPIGAVGFMVADSGSKTSHLKLTHGYAHYSSRPGRVHIDCGAIFCFEGEVDGTDAYTVAFDRDQLDLTPYVNVSIMLDRHQALLEGDPTKAMLEPFEADESNAHTIHSRGGMFIPFELVEFLFEKDLQARDAYLVVYPLLEDNYMLEVCPSLLGSLQVASTQPTAGNHCPPTLQNRLGKVDHPVRSAVTNQRRTAVLYYLLPSLAPTNQGHLPDTFAKTLADGLTNINVEMHTNRRARETRV
jgi:hypothetical protein